MLFYTGVRRSASEELAAQFESRPGSSLPPVEENLKEVRRIGFESYHALQDGELKAFADLMTQQWKLKLARSPSPVHQQVDGWIEQGIAAGALGGKLVGAGGGGFLLLYADAKSDLRVRMAELGLEEVRFSFDYEGSKILVT
jgi:D-glycero-alpha-D-manno-heptose-7-phosphate kinase